MNPYKESIHITDMPIPVRVLTTSSNGKHIQVHPHWHEEIEILYYLEGHARQQIGDVVFEAHKGDIVIIGSNEIHSTYATLSDATKIIIIQFDSSIIDTDVCKYPHRQPLRTKQYQIIYPLPITSSEIGLQVAECITNIALEFDVKKNGFEYFIKSELLKLTGILARAYGYQQISRAPKTANIRYSSLLTEVFKIIDLHYSEEISLSSIAKAVNLSKAHFCRLFKKTTGTTFKDYLNFYRINKAEELLYHNNISITDICFQCGFNNVASFYRAFSRYKNTTPSSYRKRLYE